MAIPNVAIQSFERYSQTTLNTSQTTVEKKGEDGEVISAAQQRKTELNRTILQANYNVSIGAKDDSTAVLFKTAIDAINKELEPTLGKNAAQKAFDDGIDFSPQAVADRIVGFATSFFSLYQQQHADDPLEDQLTNFLDVVGGGVDKGFGEAKDILTGLDVFNGEVEKNANQTYDLIFEGFSKFKDNVLEAANGPREQQTAQEAVAQ
jgi:hypothetical protein